MSITFNELFEDPHAKELIEYIVKTIDPKETNSAFVQGMNAEQLELLIRANQWTKVDVERLGVLLRNAGFLRMTDYMIMHNDHDHITRVYIIDPEILTHSDIVNVLKELV